MAADLTADTSVVVPALADWHPLHAAARASVRDVSALPGHVLVETVAVLTRLPGGLAARVADVTAALAHNFPDAPLVLGPDEHRRLLQVLGSRRVSGGRVYDALVGATAAAAGVRLLSADDRARPTYAAVGADVVPLEE